MSATKVKIDPSKMTRKVRLLFETSIVKNLSPYKLAPYLRVSSQQIYRWYSGDVPKPGSEALIDLGLEKIRELPDFIVEGKATWGELWIDDTPERRKERAAEAKFHAQMKDLFDQLQRKITTADRAVLFQTPNVWPDFEEVMWLLRKYNVKLPKF